LLYSFEDFSLDTARRELRRGEALIALQPQVFDLLEYVIRNRERVVTKDDLLAAVWHGRIVSESTLSTRITRSDVFNRSAPNLLSNQIGFNIEQSLDVIRP
jgi:DNA-binding winged helix-turn-helix (wHTH) protein